MASLFNVLFPEIWAMVRDELVTPLDARNRVSLQRTCKAAHALDPGLILAPMWRAAWNKVVTGPDETIRHHPPRIVSVTTRHMKRHRLAWDEHRRGILLAFLAQLDRERFFEKCPPPFGGPAFFRYAIGYGPWCDGIELDWTLLWESDESESWPVVAGSLTYTPGMDAGPEWEMKAYFLDHDDADDFMKPIYFCSEPPRRSTLAKLLADYPRLFFDTVFDINNIQLHELMLDDEDE